MSSDLQGWGFKSVKQLDLRIAELQRWIEDDERQREATNLEPQSHEEVTAIDDVFKEELARLLALRNRVTPEGRLVPVASLVAYPSPQPLILVISFWLAAMAGIIALLYLAL